MHSRMKVSTVRVLVMMAVLAVLAATGSAAMAASSSVVTKTITTSPNGEKIIFAFKKYADVSDKVSGGIHKVTLSTGCFSASGFAPSMMLFKIDYWLKTHRKGQTRTGASSQSSSDTTPGASSQSSSATPVASARIKHH